MTEFRSVSTTSEPRADGLAPDQVDELIERGYTPRTGFGSTSWDPPEPRSSLVEIIGAAGAVLLLMMVVGFVGYWLVR